ncbi:MAG: tetratricopeptide repeat protein, partial [Psychromonas sp.]
MKSVYFNIQIEKVLFAITLACAILLSACSESTDSQSTSNPDSYLQQGQAYLEQHQFKAAFSAANLAIKADPNRLEGYLILTKINEQSGQPQQSIKLLDAFTGVKNTEYYFALLDAYQKSGKLISAQNLINEQEKTLQEQPERFKMAQAQQLLYKNQFPQAKIAFQELLENPLYKIDCMLALANIELRLDNSDNIEAVFKIIDEVIELDPKNIDAIYLKSTLYISMNDLDNAEELLSQALIILPTADVFTNQRIQIIQTLANVLTQQGRSAEAMIYTRILSDEFPEAESLSLQYTRALESYKNQQFTEAKALLTDILDSNPSDKKSATLLGLILYNEGDLKNADKYLSDVVDPEISPLKLTELYATSQLQQNKSDNVLALLEYVPEANRNVDTWVLYGRAAIQQKEFSKAKIALDKAIALAPNSVQVALLADYYYTNLPEPQPEMAAQAISAGLAANPENLTLQILHIRKLLRLNNKQAADNYVASLKKTYTGNINTQLIVANYYTYQQKLDKAEQIIENILAVEKNNIQAMYSRAKINEIKQNWQQSIANYK